VNTYQFTVPAEHPALPGHFPGQPIVPGVVLLDAARAMLAAGETWGLRSIPTAKFLQAVRPGDGIELRVEWTRDARSARARFQGLRNGSVVFEGSFVFAPEAGS